MVRVEARHIAVVCKIWLVEFVFKKLVMATIIKIPKIKSTKKELQKELQKFALPGRNPDKATEELYGLWEGKDICIEKIRKKNTHNKWL